MIAIGRALAAVRDDVVYPDHPDLPEIRRGALDVDWLPVVGRGARDLVVLTRDKKIRTKSAEALALRDHGVRVIFLTGSKDLTRWGKLELLVRSWDRMERAITRTGAGPWALSLTIGTIKDLPLW
jgi:hypothetical protein